jgi:formylglycine-generating enzyme required for sulfatase activity
MNLEESYRTLGLNPGASLQEVRRSYYRLVKFFHPDRHQGSSGLLQKATEETKKINLAYERIRKIFGATRGSSPEKPKREKSARRKNSSPPPVQGQSYVIPSCGIKLNWTAPGCFLMGSSLNEAGRSNDEGPQTKVTISHGFWLGIFAVTQDEWKNIAEDVIGLNAEPSYFRGERLPVEQVSWHDCQNWLQALNEIEQEANRLPPGFRYRLPTEAEWEFACRAGTSTAYDFGEAEAALADHAWFSANSASRTHTVGEKKANKWGFHDMHGNVWEWCEDWYGALAGGNISDPKGPVRGMNRVFRGGSWGVAASRCRSAYRVWNKPIYRDYTLGFRVALAPTV